MNSASLEISISYVSLARALAWTISCPEGDRDRSRRGRKRERFWSPKMELQSQGKGRMKWKDFFL